MANFKHILSLKNNPEFSRVMKDLILGKELEYQDQVFILSCALLLIKYLEVDKENRQRLDEILPLISQPAKKIKQDLRVTKKELVRKSKTLWSLILDGKKTNTADEEKRLVRELAYYIIVRYSTIYNDYQPLYDFAVNLGYYPISRFILKNIWKETPEKININHIFSDIYASAFSEGDKTLTLEQKEYTQQLLENNSQYKVYIAPTSYGKSEFISQIISKTDAKNIVIVSPTKILVRQNGQMIKEFLKSDSAKKFRVIYHHDMYKDDTPTIASFTQERGLRFLKEFPDKYFDYIIIDEAHELFKNDSRSHLLEIFKQKNKHRNPKQQVLYLSPVIEDPQNFKNEEINNDPPLFGKKIKYSLKEVDIFYYKETQGYKYNRFLDELYEENDYQDEFDYIKRKSLDKNLIFTTSPKEIERCSKELSENIENLQNPELKKLSDTLAEEVHPDFYLNKCIKSGVLYLHGKLPDEIREYIVSKFKNDSFPAKYLIANTVVLSGANFPIDNLFIKDFSKGGKTDIINLIGRVNRLKYIFAPKNKNLKKLLAPVHFLDSLHRDKNGKVSYPLETKMKHLKSMIFEDDIKNDLLNPEPIRGRKSEKIFNEELKKYQKNHKKKEILVNMQFSSQSKESITKTTISELIYLYDLQDLYKDIDIRIPEIFKQISSASKIPDANDIKGVFDLIYHIFFALYEEKDYIDIFGDYALARLKYPETRKFYIGFIKAQRAPLNEQIEREIGYYKFIQKSKNPIIYVGSALGEIPYKEGNYYSGKINVAINLKDKKPAELVNIAISKIHIEREYVSFQLHKFFHFLYDIKLLSIETYNSLIYGSTDEKFIELVKQGLPMSIVHLLNDNQLLSHITLEDYSIVGDQSYTNFYNQQSSDFLKFTLDQYIDK